MKTKRSSWIWMALVVLVVCGLFSCDFQTRVEFAGDTRSEMEFQITTEFATSRSTTINNDVAIASVWVKAFNSEEELLTPTTGAVVNGAIQMTKVDNKWQATLRIVPDTAVITFFVWAQNAAGEHLYKGMGTLNAGSGQSITVGTGAGYAVGDTGPGGGIVVHDKGVFSDGWRYIEAAPYDFSYTWAGIPIDVTNVFLDDDGNVRSNGTENIVLSTKDWYWGPPDSLLDEPPVAANYGTTKPIGAGVLNKVILTLDDVGGVTPKLAKGNGRPTPPEEGNTMRRDTAKTLSGGTLIVPDTPNTVLTAQNINGFSDWVVPSKDELNAMYTHRVALGMEPTYYWSSSESLLADTPTKSISNTAGYNAEDLNSWMINFSTGTAVQELRNVLAQVRPVRRF